MMCVHIKHLRPSLTRLLSVLTCNGFEGTLNGMAAIFRARLWDDHIVVFTVSRTFREHVLGPGYYRISSSQFLISKAKQNNLKTILYLCLHKQTIEI